MYLSSRDVFYEQVVLGMKGMVEGVVIDREASWLLFPLFLLIRGFAYGYTHIISFVRGG